MVVMNMKAFDVQSIEIKAPLGEAFDYIADPKNLPEWTHAFKSVSDGKAILETSKGSVEVKLCVHTSKLEGTIDWIIKFPDGGTASAYSRLVDSGKNSSIYSFVLLAPPAPLEQLEGALQRQVEILREELSNLARILKNLGFRKV
jgi:hypothetical protein